MQDVKPAHKLPGSGTAPLLMPWVSAGDTGCAAEAGCPTEAGDMIYLCLAGWQQARGLQACLARRHWPCNLINQ